MFEYYKKQVEEQIPDIEELLSKDNAKEEDDATLDNEMECLKQEVELLSEINLLKSKLKKGTGLKRKLVDKVRLRIKHLENLLSNTRNRSIGTEEHNENISDNSLNVENNTEIGMMIDRASNVLDASLNLRKKSKSVRNKLFKKSGELEVTWERVILAEKMRQALISKLKSTETPEKLSFMSSLTTEYVNYINSR